MGLTPHYFFSLLPEFFVKLIGVRNKHLVVFSEYEYITEKSLTKISD